MSIINGPKYVIWDMTYACPLRCTHCYSESGRRPARQLGHQDMLRVADALIAMGAEGVALAGGEPMLVRGLVEVAGRLTRAGISVVIYTSGWLLRPEAIEPLAQAVSEIHVSVDGATAQTHDRIRGRAGSFQRAMDALAMLDAAARDRVQRGGTPFRFGIDCVVMQSNFHQLEAFCTDIVPRFPALQFISFNAVAPAGLASRPGFSEHELLTDAQADLLGTTARMRELQALVASSVEVFATDNRSLQMHPDAVARGLVFEEMTIEADGEVRAMPMYEGTVGNILTEPVDVIWERAVARWSDPFVVDALSGVRTIQDWAAATRRIDHHFGSDAVRARIARRPVHLALAPS